MAVPESPRDEEVPSLVKRAARSASERVFDIVDPDVVLDHVDVNALLGRIDVNSLLERIDVNDLLERIDIDALLGRADIDALLNQVDIKSLVERAGVPQMVADSTSQLGEAALDLVRKPIVGLDEIISRLLNGLVRRDFSSYPESPGELARWADDHAVEQERIKTGRYAGPLSRLLAVIADSFVVSFGFTLILASVQFLIGLFVAGDFVFTDSRPVGFGIAAVTWAFLYMWVSLAVFGKTVGKTILGVRVVGWDGTIAVTGRQAFVRTITYPLSFIILGIGLLGVVFGRERRAWHDHFGGTAVVYDWGSRTAHMPTPLAEFLERRSDETTTSATALIAVEEEE